MGIVANTTTVSLLQVANGFMRVCNSTNVAVTGSGSVTVPSYARGVVVIAIGAGGGGNTIYGGSGGGTLYLHRLVESGQTINFNIGTGGTATTVGSGNGGNGGKTNVTIGSITYEAYGGEGGGVFSNGGVTDQSDIWNNSAPAGYETNIGRVGEIDGTGGVPGLWEENLYNDYLFGIPFQGEGGNGTPVPSNGGNGAVIFKWLACPLQTNVYTGGQSGTITAPTDAEFVIIKAWGAGGGGRNNPGPAGGSYGGGGGGGFVIKRMPVTGGSSSFTYSVGSGGAGNGSNGGNTTITDAVTIDAGGGGGGTVSAGGAGGIASGGDIDSEAGSSGLSGGGLGVPGLPGRWNEVNQRDKHYNETQKYYSDILTENAGQPVNEPVWDVVTNSGTPGQGGSGDFEAVGGNADPGANGEIRFEWFTSKPRLSKFRSNTTVSTGFLEKAVLHTTPNNAAGFNGMIAETGNIDLLDFRDATVVKNQLSLYNSGAARVTYANTEAVGRADLEFSNTGFMTLSSPDDAASLGSYPEPMSVAWLLRNSNNCDVNTTNEFDVRVTKTSGPDPIEGSANNTWLNLDQERLWYVQAISSNPSSPPGGFQSNTCNVLVEIRRTDTDQIVTSFSVQLLATSQSNSGPPP